MPNYKVYLGGIKDSSPLNDAEAGMLRGQAGMPVRVTFDEGQSAILGGHPRAAVWAQMINRLQRRSRPVYVEVDADTDIITRLCIPVVTKVLEMSEVKDGLADIVLSASDALHTLREDSPGFGGFYEALRQARDAGSSILVTATLHEFDIVDVRELPKSFIRGPLDPLPPPGPVVPVSTERCSELFDMVSGKSCELGAVATPCIPYKYPYSGCNVRAHIMCLQMRSAGATPQKIWISGGGLRAKSPNVPKCEVGWGWHVAPTLEVMQPGGDPVTMVLDPSLCDGPVTVAFWKSLMGKPNALLTHAQWEGYYVLAKGTATDDEAYEDLDDYRDRLVDFWKESPPPYNCLS